MPQPDHLHGPATPNDMSSVQSSKDSPVRIRQTEQGLPQRTGSFHLENMVVMVDMTQSTESPTITPTSPDIKPTHQLELKPVSLTPATERTPLSRPTSPTRSTVYATTPPVSPSTRPPSPPSVESSHVNDLAAFQRHLIKEAERISQANAKAVEAVVQNNLAAATRIQTRVTYEAERIRKLMDKWSDEYNTKEESFFEQFCCGCIEP
jgi:hypothetical protein